MKRITLGLTALALIVMQGDSVQSQENAQPTPKKLELPFTIQVAKMDDLIKTLNEEIELKDFQIPMKMKDAFGLIYEKAAQTGKDMPILVDEAAFKADFVKLHPAEHFANDPYEAVVRFPAFPKRVTKAALLEMALAQLPQRNGTYLIRKGMIVITTKTKASVKSLLEEKVLASFHNKPLAEAIYVMADLTGADIVIDPRVGDKALTLVSATFGNTSTLEGALTILTDMADLKMVVVGESIYVTSPANAEKLSKPTKK